MFYILLIAVSCHVPVCVRLSHSIKRLLTYLLTYIPLPIATKHELGIPFPPMNLPIKFGTNPSTIFLVIVVTDRHTDTQTDAGENIFPRFCGVNMVRN